MNGKNPQQKQRIIEIAHYPIYIRQEVLHGRWLRKSVAFIINGDRGHQGHVEAAIRTLREENPKIELHVVSPEPPTGLVASYSSAPYWGLAHILAGRSDDDDHVFVYVTGQSKRGSGDLGAEWLASDPWECIKFGSRFCYPLPFLQRDLAAVPHAFRTVVLENNTLASGLKLFADPKTTVITLSSLGNHPMTLNFFGKDKDIPRPDQNKAPSTQERYAHALSQEDGAVFLAQYHPSAQASSLTGIPSLKSSFPAKVIEVHTEAELDTQIEKVSVTNRL